MRINIEISHLDFVAAFGCEALFLDIVNKSIKANGPIFVGTYGEKDFPVINKMVRAGVLMEIEEVAIMPVCVAKLIEFIEMQKQAKKAKGGLK